MPSAAHGSRQGSPHARYAAESQLARTRRARKIGRELAATYPDAHCELDFTDPYQLLAATILSAQCTDARVNSVTPALFRAYPTPADLAAAAPADVEAIIRPTGFYRAKARSLQGMANAVCTRHGGEIPRQLADLVELPGVGRKTANVVLGNAFGVPGLTVDTHFGRLSRRFGWTVHDDPVKVETDVSRLFPRRDWTLLSHRLIWHGRRICFARRPACGVCPVARWCPSFGEGPTDPLVAGRKAKVMTLS